jgi:repressor LexA
MDIELIRVALDRPGKSKGGLAQAMGVGNSAITALLKGDRQIKAHEVPMIAEYLGLYSIPVMGFVGAGASIDPDFEQVPPEGLRTIDLPFPLPGDMIAFEVRGDSMLPRYDEGDVIVVWKEARRPLDSYYGEEVAVRTSTGRRYLKTVTRGKGRAVTLTSFNAKTIENVKLAWIGEIYLTIRARQFKKAVASASNQAKGSQVN